VWVDTLVAVGAYVRAQQVFEDLTPSQDTWTWTSTPARSPGRREAPARLLHDLE
jgi:hypothetical protein